MSNRLQTPRAGRQPSVASAGGPGGWPDPAAALGAWSRAAQAVWLAGFAAPFAAVSPFLLAPPVFVAAAMRPRE